MSAHLSPPSLLGLLAMLAGTAVAQEQSPASAPATFSIRVDPSMAAEVNSVLARYAENAVVDVNAGDDVTAFLKRRCGDKSIPDIVSVVPLSNGKHRVTHTPCARLGGSRIVTVEPGLTLEGIALRSGLRSDTVSRMTIQSGQGNPNRSTIVPTAMLPGDRVMVPQTSLWTEIQIRQDARIGRDELLSAIAVVVGCTRDLQECVRRKGVLLLPQGQPAARSTQAPSVPEAAYPEPKTSLEPLSQVRSVSATSLRDLVAGVSVVTSAGPPQFPPIPEITHPEAKKSPEPLSQMREVAATSLPDQAASASVVISPAPAAAATSQGAAWTTASPLPLEFTPAASPLAAVRIADGQWPYDVERVAAALNADHDLLHAVVVGVADGGLRESTGAPLPANMLASNSGEVGGEDNDDDDENEYVDDLYGAGIRRNDDANLATDKLGTGKLDLCPNRPDFTAWSPKALLLASHGSMVSSIAAGWPLRAQPPSVSSKLPRIQFFRLVSSMCDPDSQFEVRESEINKSLMYLFQQEEVEVVNLSYKIAIRGKNPYLRNAVHAQLNDSIRMLVVAAGNDEVDDLDDGELCPACLGSPSAGDLVPRVLVVGAAEPTLQASPTSNRGEKTVRFFAPGQANGIDILGRPVSDGESATSYAAPLAALAVAVLKAYGVSDWKAINERLEAASWPLLIADGSTHPTARVIDLTKVVSVYRDVVEATVLENGVPVRRDYVGTIPDKIQDIGICGQGRAFTRATVHSIRLGPVQSDGTRSARWDQRRTSGAIFVDRSTNSCRSSGSIVINDILGQRVTIPLGQVNQILLHWRTPPAN